MNIPVLPRDMLQEIATAAIPEQPKNLTRNAVRAWGRKIVTLSKVNSQFRRFLAQKLVDVKKIYYLIEKYNKYNEAAEESIDWKGSPQLLDALFTGCNLPFAYSTFKKYDQDIENDIREIVKLMPNTVHCNIGTLRCRSGVTPLFAACMNTVIPVSIIELLLDSGANPRDQILLNNQPVDILSDLKGNVCKERFQQIEKLFRER